MFLALKMPSKDNLCAAKQKPLIFISNLLGQRISNILPTSSARMMTRLTCQPAVRLCPKWRRKCCRRCSGVRRAPLSRNVLQKLLLSPWARAESSLGPRKGWAMYVWKYWDIQEGKSRKRLRGSWRGLGEVPIDVRVLTTWLLKLTCTRIWKGRAW